jgi:hypothetical protein
MVASPGSRDDRMVGRAGLTPFKNLERVTVTGIEPALSAWEAERCELRTGLACTGRAPRLTVRDRPSPRLMAR